ncbi:isopentenyl phosphate kinase family protein [Candidatus Roizmanbacteria bacterium]|nr:MAG: isopentenyl phosphate kinase family protein [Candidatus Roizmanbacteria bacterium]
MNITLLKLGGSLITDKAKPYTTLPDRIERIAKEISEARGEMKNEYLILGNGAGSFAHQSAAKYDTVHGFIDEQSLYGACVVHADAMELNRIMVQAFLKKNLPVFSIQPSALYVAKEKTVVTEHMNIVESMLEKEYIPFVYGDVIIDQKQGSTIFSTDTIFKYLGSFLAEKGHSVRIIHAGSYPGVLDQSKNVIPKITPEMQPELSQVLYQPTNTDVTGGMKLKVEEMLALTRLGVESVIIDGKSEGSIYQVLKGHRSGTTVSAS